MNLKLEFQFTFEEFAEAQRAHIRSTLKPSGKTKRLYAALFVILFVFCFCMLQRRTNSATEPQPPTDDQASSLSSLVISLLPYLGMFALIILAVVFTLRGGLRRLWQNERHAKGNQIIELTDRGVHQETRLTSVDLAWPAFIRWLETPNLFVLYATEASIVIIPKRPFPTQSEIDVFRDFLMQTIPQDGSRT